MVREVFDAEENDVALGADIDFTDADADAIRKHGHVIQRRRLGRKRHVGGGERFRLGLRYLRFAGRRISLRLGLCFVGLGFRFAGLGFRSLQFLAAIFGFGLLARFDLVVFGLGNRALGLQYVEQSAVRVVRPRVRRCNDQG